MLVRPDTGYDDDVLLSPLERIYAGHLDLLHNLGEKLSGDS